MDPRDTISKSITKQYLKEVKGKPRGDEKAKKPSKYKGMKANEFLQMLREKYKRAKKAGQTEAAAKIAAVARKAKQRVAAMKGISYGTKDMEGIADAYVPKGKKRLAQIQDGEGYEDYEGAKEKYKAKQHAKRMKRRAKLLQRILRGERHPSYAHAGSPRDVKDIDYAGMGEKLRTAGGVAFSAVALHDLYSTLKRAKEALVRGKIKPSQFDKLKEHFERIKRVRQKVSENKEGIDYAGLDRVKRAVKGIGRFLRAAGPVGTPGTAALVGGAYYLGRRKRKKTDSDMACATPGRKIRSKGKGRGLAIGRGRGPIGRMGKGASMVGLAPSQPAMKAKYKAQVKKLRSHIKRMASKAEKEGLDACGLTRQDLAGGKKRKVKKMDPRDLVNQRMTKGWVQEKAKEKEEGKDEKKDGKKKGKFNFKEMIKEKIAAKKKAKGKE